MCEEYDIYRQCYCGCVFGAQDQGIDLVKVKKEAAAFMTGKDLEKDYSHIKFTVIDQFLIDSQSVAYKKRTALRQIVLSWGSSFNYVSV